MRKNVLLSLSSAAILGLGVGAVGGCAGHGKYTEEHISGAKSKMSAMKAATEWQTARAAYLSGELDKALKHVEISITLNGEVLKSHVLRGRIALELGNIEQAVESFERAEKIDPKSAEPQYYLGVLNERIARKDTALERYLKASELEPSNAQYAVAAAEVMIDLGRTDEAKAFLTKDGKSFDHNPGVRQTLGHLAMIQGDPNGAVKYFNEARLLAADDLSILEDLARAQVSAGQFAEADHTLSRLLSGEEMKDRRDLQLLRAQVLVKIDRMIDARAILLNLSRDPESAADVEVWVTLGNVCYLLNDTTRVRQAAGRTLALAPDRPEGYTLRGLLARQAQDLEVALSNFRQSVAVGPSADRWVLLGLTQLDMDRVEDAKRSFEAALKLDPQCASAKSLLSQVPG